MNAMPETHQGNNKDRKLELQRKRRSTRRRIDYYVSEEAAAVIKANCRPYVGWDMSSVINRIIMAWKASGISQVHKGKTSQPGKG